ncbi:hypothetical protein IWQ60_003392 [Tieghemiomyces parasiticus]|uniref:Amino acid transporter transmembrane domain-containing protein n=1 Tax=Tieghemiomyces parasiticus TaxID=78921 RepID=A0A9W8AG95_9FUNG|nr:hypothetical protein IWQ60_003392 [Tieghemiomyces parasiticus]
MPPAVTLFHVDDDHTGDGDHLTTSRHTDRAPSTDEHRPSSPRRSASSGTLRERSRPSLAVDHSADFYDPASTDHAPSLPIMPASTALGSFFNMTNAIVGAGIIGLPFAFKEAGLFAGILLLLLLAYITDWTLRLLAYATKLSGRHTYQELVCFCFGLPGFHAISVFQFIFAFGGMCAFNVIIGDTVPHVIRSVFPAVLASPVLSTLTSRQAVITIITLGVSFPLSLYRDMSKLAKTSALALVAMMIIVISVLVEAPKAPDGDRGTGVGKWDFVKPDIFQAIGVISFAFVCHHNSFMIYSALQMPTLNRYGRIIHVSTALSALVCLLLASVGYLNFTDKTRGNILNNFPDDNLFINIARFCFGFNMITTFPMELLVAREVVDGYVGLYSRPHHAPVVTRTTAYIPLESVADLHDALDDEATPDPTNPSHEPSAKRVGYDVSLADVPFSLRRHLIVTTAMVLTTLTVALNVCDLGIVIELTGGISATALAFILPAACYLKLVSGPIFHPSKWGLWVLLAFGVCVLVFSPTLAVYRFLHQDPSERHTC